MSNMGPKELLQAKALGCLDPEDDAIITKLMNEDDNFPWQELGHYQNLVAFLPTLLDIEIPAPEVKDNVARKLYELGEKIKANKEEKVKQTTITEEAELDKIEEDGLILEEEPIEKTEIPIVGEDPIDVGNTTSGISIKEHGIQLQATLNDEKRMMQEPGLKKHKRGPEPKVTPAKPKKEFEQTIDESYNSKYFAGAYDDSSTSKKGFIVTIILFAVTLLLLILIYFNLSSDIQENREKIDRLEIELGSEIMLENNLSHKIFNT